MKNSRRNRDYHRLRPDEMVWEQGQGVYDDNGGVTCLEGLIIDINDRKKDEIKLKYLSEHDPVTGLLICVF